MTPLGKGAGPGRPRKEQTDGHSDAEAARAGLAEQVERPARGATGKFARRPQPTPAVVVADALTPEEISGAGLMIQDGFKLIAGIRGPHWDIVHDEDVPRVGRPAALMLRKYGPMADKYPELALALVLAPGIFAAVKVEVDAVQAEIRRRRTPPGPPGIATPGGVQRRDPGSEGLGQDVDGAVVVGTPLAVAHR